MTTMNTFEQWVTAINQFNYTYSDIQQILQSQIITTNYIDIYNVLKNKYPTVSDYLLQVTILDNNENVKKLITQYRDYCYFTNKESFTDKNEFVKCCEYASSKINAWETCEIGHRIEIDKVISALLSSTIIDDDAYFIICNTFPILSKFIYYIDNNQIVNNRPFALSQDSAINLHKRFCIYRFQYENNNILSQKPILK